jgi:hypothetical protein
VRFGDAPVSIDRVGEHLRRKDPQAVFRVRRRLILKRLEELSHAVALLQLPSHAGVEV